MTQPRAPLLPGLPGDKLVAPLNAPAAGQAVSGVQPGVTGGIILAQYVVVFGATGGVFIYAGSPALGNPPLYWMGNVTADPYGNPVDPGIWAGTSSGPQVGLQVNGDAGELIFPFPGTFTADARVGAIEFGSGVALEIIGAQDASPDNDLVYMALADNTAGGGGATWFLVYQDADGGSNVLAFGNYSGTTIYTAAVITAAQPGTGTSPTNPATVEFWHLMSYKNSWAQVSGWVAAQYRKVASPPNSVEIIGTLNAAAASSGTFFTLPTGYIPASKQPVCSMGANASVPSAQSPWIACDTSGNLTVENSGAAGAAWQGFYHGFISLDA